jgi:hypothetical protein
MGMGLCYVANALLCKMCSRGIRYSLHSAFFILHREQQEHCLTPHHSFCVCADLQHLYTQFADVLTCPIGHAVQYRVLL